MGEMPGQYPEYELAGIETIARGVCICDGEILLCKAKKSRSSYLPGGHIEFGETAREALVREIREELGVECSTGDFLGAVENRFDQHGKPHAEINLVFRLDFAPDTLSDLRSRLSSQEEWIEFVWWPLSELGSSGLLPERFRDLARPEVFFDI